MKPFKGFIHSWKMRKVPSGGFVVVGVPQGHPDFVDWIVTSIVVNMFEIPRHRGDPRRFRIETLNSVYELVGDESSKEMICPDSNYKRHGLTPP